MSTPFPGLDRLRVLVVCTANVCRSPIAERLLARHLADRGVEAVVTSAGVRGGRLPVHEDTALAARRVDLDLRNHTSRLLAAEMIATEGADLIIGMTREHLREIVALDPRAWPRTFTLKELARRSYEVSASGSVGEWIAVASEGRKAADLMVPSADDDLDDPYGGPPRGHVEMVGEVDSLTETIAGALVRAAR